MTYYRISIQIAAALGTPLVGDTLFGQLCWAARYRFGEAHLNELLQGYAEQKPFLVLSDAMPHRHLPLPHLPSRYWAKGELDDRKKLKKKQWVSLEDSQQQAVENWQKVAKEESALHQKSLRDQPHNSISRLSGTTNEAFAPYSSEQLWYQAGTLLDIYAVLDEQRLSLAQLNTLLNDIGEVGFGRDASIGLGRFKLVSIEPFDYLGQGQPNCYLALANSAPQKLDLDKSHCYYQITTRFGRHGGLTGLSQNPFKKPLILAKAGAVFKPNHWQPRLFLGNGLINVSNADARAVHQGYAPVIPLAIKFK